MGPISSRQTSFCSCSSEWAKPYGRKSWLRSRRAIRRLRWTVKSPLAFLMKSSNKRISNSATMSKTSPITMMNANPTIWAIWLPMKIHTPRWMSRNEALVAVIMWNCRRFLANSGRNRMVLSFEVINWAVSRFWKIISRLRKIIRAAHLYSLWIDSTACERKFKFKIAQIPKFRFKLPPVKVLQTYTTFSKIEP